MTRYERKLFFERLMDMRDAYRAETHVSSDTTLDQVVAFAEQTYNDAADADLADAAVIAAETAPKANPAAF